MPQGEGTWPVSWIPSSSRAALPPGMRPLAATVRRRPAGGCGPAPASGIQPSGMQPQPGPGRARVRRRRPARRRVCHDRWPVRTPVAWARAAAHRRAVSGHCRPRPRAGAGGPCAFTRCRVVRGGGVMRCAGRRVRSRKRRRELIGGAPHETAHIVREGIWRARGRCRVSVCPSLTSWMGR